jgi:hypothetical protein
MNTTIQFDEVSLAELDEGLFPPLVKCSHCGKPTYNRKELARRYPDRNYILPSPFTVANARRFVRVHGIEHLVCTDCRYGYYGRY